MVCIHYRLKEYEDDKWKYVCDLNKSVIGEYCLNDLSLTGKLYCKSFENEDNSELTNDIYENLKVTEKEQNSGCVSGQHNYIILDKTVQSVEFYCSRCGCIICTDRAN